MSKNKKQVRDKFRTAVFERDGHRCRGCGVMAVDAHHITDRNEMPGGGYVKENGISLCILCHAGAEQYHVSGGKTWKEGFHPDDLYRIIGSSKELAYEKARESEKNSTV